MIDLGIVETGDVVQPPKEFLTGKCNSFTYVLAEHMSPSPKLRFWIERVETHKRMDSVEVSLPGSFETKVLNNVDVHVVEVWTKYPPGIIDAPYGWARDNTMNLVIHDGVQYWG